MVLEGAHGDGSRSGRRKAGWETLPRGDSPIDVDGWYPPSGVPATTIVNIIGDARPEIVVSLNDGYVYAFDASGHRLWRTDTRHGLTITFNSETTVADLNQDGSPELLLATFGDPDVHSSGHLMILSAATGAILHDLPAAQPRPQRQRQRRAGRTGGGRSRRRRSARGLCPDLRSRSRCLHRPRLRNQLPHVADRPRRPAANGSTERSLDADRPLRRWIRIRPHLEMVVDGPLT